MTPHKYPPLPQAQRDDDDRIGEILDTVRRIEARDTSYLSGQIEALVEENDRLREEMDRAGSEWRNAMADCLRSHGVDVVRMTIVGNTVEVVVGEDDGDKVAKAIWNTVPINLTPVGKCEAEHDGHKIRFSRATSPSPRGRIFAEVIAERERQEAKFPGQRLPLVEPDDEPGRIDLRRAVDRLRNRESAAREVCEARSKDGSLTWLDVASEEFSEAMHALAKLQAGIGGREAARAELIQVMAVCARILESEHFEACRIWDDQDAADDNVVAEGGYTKG